MRSRAALEGERKQVTVLFADIKGSMELAEQVDPEEWYRLMDRFFQILTDGVHHFEGTVNQYTGDGIMALFGAPIAHEDHAQRACWAALHLGDALRRYAEDLKRTRGLTFAVRMGLNSGEVVVGKIGDDLRMDYTAQGHVVGLAARMEQLADPGRVYVTEHTARLASGYFRLRDLGPFTIKGVHDLLRVYELEGVGTVRTRLEVSRTRGFSKFVGRTTELATLEAALERAIAGSGQVVGVVGEPGLGKSRLCFEFVQACRARGISVAEAHALPHGKTIPLLPWIEYMRTYFGVTDQDGAETARDKIAGRTLRLDEQLVEALPILFEFLGIPDPARPAPRMQPEALQRQLAQITQRLMVARSRREPLVHLFEDLHWLDAATDVLLAAMIHAVPDTRTLILVTSRPEYHAPWMRRDIPAEPLSYQHIALQPLGTAAIDELLTDLLGVDPALSDLRALIRERTAGNPFFIEEVVQALVDQGILVRDTVGATRRVVLTRPIADIRIPPTVQAILAARIDRLGERDKAVLQTAAVIGKEFTEPVLRAVLFPPSAKEASPPLPPFEKGEEDLAEALHALSAAEFIYEAALYPVAEYAFKHPLTQEVAYHSQLGDRRKHVHAAVARAVEASDPTKLDEGAALLAHHWEGAAEPWIAAQWHQRAAVWVGGRDRREAHRHWHQVRTLLAQVPESPDALALGALARGALLVGAAYLGQSDEETAALCAEGTALATRLGDRFLQARIHATYALARCFSGALDDAVAHVRKGLRLADESGDPLLRLLIRVSGASVLYAAGCLREVLALADEVEKICAGDVDLGAAFTGFSPYGIILGYRSIALTLTGQPAAGARAAEHAEDIARRRNDLDVLWMSRLAQAVRCQTVGDGPGVLAYARQAVEIAAVLAATITEVASLTTMGAAHNANAQWPEAIDALTRALALARERHTGLQLEAQALAHLANAYLGSNQLDRARAVADQAVAVARERGVRDGINALLARAHVLLQAEGARAATDIERDLEEAMALVQRTETHAYVPVVGEARAELARLLGDLATWERELREAHRLFVAMGATGHAERTSRQLSAVSPQSEEQ